MRKIEYSIEKEFKKLPKEIKEILRERWLSTEHVPRKELTFENEEDSQLYLGRQLIYLTVKQYLFNKILDQNEEFEDKNESGDIKYSIEKCLKSLNTDYERFIASYKKPEKHENPQKVYDDAIKYLINVLNI